VPTDTPVPTLVPTDTPVPTLVPTDTPVPTLVPTDTPVPTSAPTAIPPDTTPPPVPTPYVPTDGLVIDCPATEKQTLVWLPVTDPSGVVYYVKLERQVTATVWDSVRGWGPLEGKQVEADVQCGGIYRWAVRAEDGAGNISEWSEWFTFSIDLT